MDNIHKMLKEYGAIINPIGISIYIFLFLNSVHKEIQVSELEIAQAIGLHQRKTIGKYIRVLQSCGLISKGKPKRYGDGKIEKSIYIISSPKEWGNPKEMSTHEEHVEWLSKKEKKCLLCGFQIVERCHVLAKMKDGSKRRENIVLLCPNHRKMFDKDKLTVEDMKKIEDDLKQ